MSQLDSSVADMPSADAYQFLLQHSHAVLIDVRTRAEWTFVGAPVLPFRDGDVIFVEWQSWPEMKTDPDFAPRLGAELERRGVGADAPLLFLCRSGQRSRAAAQAMLAAGWRRCVNIGDGFEGPLDAQGHRGAVGWRGAGLPWRQS